MSLSNKASNIIHHRATRPGTFYRWLRNLAIVVCVLGCLRIGLGILAIIFIVARTFQFGVESLTTSWDTYLLNNLPILITGGGFIVVGFIILVVGLGVNWLVTVPVYRSANEQKPDKKSGRG